MGALAFIGPLLSLIGIGGQVLSERGAAESAAQQAEAQARLADIEAGSIESAARAEEDADRRRTARILGKQRAAGAAAGIDITSGSTLLLELDSAKEAELSALTIRQRGEVGVRGKRQEAIFARQQAKISRGRKGAAIAKGIARGGSVLTEFAGPQFFSGSATKTAGRIR